MFKKAKIFFGSFYFWLILFIVVYFAPIFFTNQVFYYGDIFTSYWPYRKFLADSLGKGIFPLWNPLILSGYPLFADISLAVYYLPNIITYLFPAMRVYSFLIIAHFAIAAIFMYRLGKGLNLSKNASFFMAVCFAFSGMLINYVADTSRMFVVSLYPLFFLTLVNLFKKGKAKWVILSALVLSLQIFAGHIQYVFIELLFCPFFLFLKEFDKTIFWQKVLLFLSVIFIGVLLSSVILLPTFELIPKTTRSEISFNHSIYQSFSLKPLSLVRFFLAHFWGVRNQGSAWGTMDSSTIGYIGFFPLLLIFLTWKKIKENKNVFLFGLGAVAALLISLGTYLPFFNLFVDVIPLFKIFRNPMSFLAIYSFFVVLVSGYAYDTFAPLGKTRKKIVFLFFGLIFVSLVTFLVIRNNRQLPYQGLLLLSGLIGKKLSLFHDLEVDFGISQLIIVNLIIIGSLGFVGFWFKNKRFLILIAFIDLLLLGRGDMFTIDNRLIKMDNPVADFLQKNTGHFRFLSSSEIVPYSGLSNYFGNLMFRPPYSKEELNLSENSFESRFTHELKMIPRDICLYYNLPTVYGEATFILKDYNDYFQKSNNLNELVEEAGKFNPLIKEEKADIALTTPDFKRVSFNDPVFDTLSVKYLVADRDLKLSHHDLILKEDGVSVYVNESAQPRAVIIGGSNEIIEEPLIVSENANSVILKTENQGLLILKDLYYPGWNVYVDGVKQEILPFEKIFRSLLVKKNNALVEFKFEPVSFRIGLSLSFVTFVFCLLVLTTQKFKK